MNYLPGVMCAIIGLIWIVGVFVCSPGPPLLESTIRIHVSYNSLTANRSKFIEGDEYILMGDCGEQIYRCSVRREFWEAASQNNHYEIPESQCRRIEP